MDRKPGRSRGSIDQRRWTRGEGERRLPGSEDTHEEVCSFPGWVEFF